MTKMKMAVVCSLVLLAACGKVTTTKPDGGTSADGGSGGGSGGGTGGGAGGGGGNAPVCGDGVKANSEGCDDGNKKADDGCSAACTIETGWTCTGTPKSSCALLTCGNSTIDAQEQCDDGNTTAGDGCSPGCKVEPGWEVEPNNTIQTANDFAVVSVEAVVHGLMDNPGDAGYSIDAGLLDYDVFKVEVPAGASGTFVVETQDFGGKLCAQKEIDSKITIRFADGGTVQLADGGSASNDDIGYPNYCSRISITNPEPGTYFVEVKASGAATGPKRRFPYSLMVAPSVCGDGKKVFPEECDDGNQVDGDGCSNACKLAMVCGNGAKQTGEACDDGNTTNGDGCDATCKVESGWACDTAVEPTSCAQVVCGNGIKQTGEGCDDGNTTSGDGCDATCSVESGYSCTGTKPSSCTKTCGDGYVDWTEDCDDGNSASGDGCSSSCTVETGWSCDYAEPSVCAQIVCGNGKAQSGEACDDGNLTNGDGCSSTCTVEAGWKCDTLSDPSVCTQNLCGNGTVNPGEDCDDGNTTSGDGCDQYCFVESNFVCTPGAGGTSVCTSACTSAKALSLGAVGVPSSVTATGKAYFSFTLASPGSVKLETALVGLAAGTCTSSNGPDLKVLKSDCSSTVVSTYSSSNCSIIDPATKPEMANMAPGTYFAVVSPYPSSSTWSYSLTATLVGQCGNGTVEPGELCDGSAGCSATCDQLCGNGKIEHFETCDDGNHTPGDGCDATCNREGTQATEVEPNDWSCTNNSCTFAAGASAQPLTSSMITVLGDHTNGADSDVYSLTLQQGAKLRIEIVEGDKSETCESNGIDSKIWLRNSTFTSLVSNDDGGRGYCSLIDGTGATPADAAASNLPAGTYYIEVNKSGLPSATAPSAQFKYKLLIDVK